MSKIEEMAKEYCQGSSFDDACMMKPAYTAGANAVLKEIEPLVATLRSGARKLFEEKFKELKGE